MEQKEFYLEVDKMRIHAKLDVPEPAPEQCPLVIVEHGLTGHMEERHICGVSQALNDYGFATLRVELYGHGKSDGDFREHTVMKWLTQMLYVIDYAASLEGVTELYLTGHSQGGLTTILAAAAKRDVLKAIIPLSPALNIWDGARKGSFLGFSFDPNRIPDEISNGDITVSGNYLRAAQLLPVREALKMYKRPVLIVHGDADEAVPVSFGEYAASEYENATLKIIPGDNHCYDYHLEQVIEAVVNFLQTVRGQN